MKPKKKKTSDRKATDYVIERPVSKHDPVVNAVAAFAEDIAAAQMMMDAGNNVDAQQEAVVAAETFDKKCKELGADLKLRIEPQLGRLYVAFVLRDEHGIIQANFAARRFNQPE